jgi:hypothetical protein
LKPIPICEFFNSFWKIPSCNISNNPRSSSTLRNYSKCGVCTVESEAGC